MAAAFNSEYKVLCFSQPWAVLAVTKLSQKQGFIEHLLCFRCRTKHSWGIKVQNYDCTHSSEERPELWGGEVNYLGSVSWEGAELGSESF